MGLETSKSKHVSIEPLKKASQQLRIFGERRTREKKKGSKKSRACVYIYIYIERNVCVSELCVYRRERETNMKCVVLFVVGVLLCANVAYAFDAQSLNSMASAFSHEPSGLPTSAFEIASDVNELSVLVEAVLGAARPELYEALSSPENANTVFAPTNEAFEKVAEELGVSMETFLSLPAPILADILFMHIVPEFSATTSELEEGQQLTTSSPSGLTITVHFDDASTVPSFISVGSVAHVVPGAEDLKVGSSLIHVVDTVLLPFELIPHNE